jgi:hypothetical protein
MFTSKWKFQNYISLGDNFLVGRSTVWIHEIFSLKHTDSMFLLNGGICRWPHVIRFYSMLKNSMSMKELFYKQKP